ncbi:MAG: hypothetical protein USCAAHI_00917 [Beijerinckiaceae bacterium]|nr:MAG: hypothetical protein USCAAHI_00917 [Beijerinckiaceae bacterium]
MRIWFSDRALAADGTGTNELGIRLQSLTGGM